MVKNQHSAIQIRNGKITSPKQVNNLSNKYFPQVQVRTQILQSDQYLTQITLLKHIINNVQELTTVNNKRLLEEGKTNLLHPKHLVQPPTPSN